MGDLPTVQFQESADGPLSGLTNMSEAELRRDSLSPPFMMAIDGTMTPSRKTMEALKKVRVTSLSHGVEVERLNHLLFKVVKEYRGREGGGERRGEREGGGGREGDLMEREGERVGEKGGWRGAKLFVEWENYYANWHTIA